MFPLICDLHILPKYKNNSVNTEAMCGRIFQTLPLLRLLQIARAKKCTNGQMHTSSYNVCPTTHIPVIKANRFYFEQKKDQQIQEEDLENEDARELSYMKWGHHSKFNMVINGRIQEMLNKRMFVNIIQNRCVVIMEGYFEWNQKKQPFSLRPKQGDHFLVAGLYTEDNEIIILTKDATPELASVHNRMPVILSHEEVNLWMNPKNTKDIQKIINTALLNKDKQVWKNVGFAKIAPYVNKLAEKSDYKKQLDKTGLMKYWKKAPAVEAILPEKELIKEQSSTISVSKVPQKIDIQSNNNKETSKQEFLQKKDYLQSQEVVKASDEKIHSEESISNRKDEEK